MALTKIRHRHVKNSATPANATNKEKSKTPSQWGSFLGKKSPMQKAQQRIDRKKDNKRWQHERKELQETHDLDEVDDDVEEATTLLEWYADEHEHRPKSPVWFAILAAATTILVSVMIFVFTNITGAITFTVVGGLIYYIAQQEPNNMRYRIMLDGIALNTTMYHWEDLEAFNIIYEPDETKTVMFKSTRTFSPYIHMEIDDADPVQIREILMEFVEEDQEIQEPLADIIARRLGF